jgi:hypothetical protein
LNGEWVLKQAKLFANQVSEGEERSDSRSGAGPQAASRKPEPEERRQPLVVAKQAGGSHECY